MKHGRGTYVYIYIFNFAYVSLSLPYSFIVYSALLLFYNLENSFLKIDVFIFFACEVDKRARGQENGVHPVKVASLTLRPTQSFMLTFTPTTNFKTPVNLTCMSMDCRRKPE